MLLAYLPRPPFPLSPPTWPPPSFPLPSFPRPLPQSPWAIRRPECPWACGRGWARRVVERRLGIVLSENDHEQVSRFAKSSSLASASLQPRFSLAPASPPFKAVTGNSRGFPWLPSAPVSRLDLCQHTLMPAFLPLSSVGTDPWALLQTHAEPRAIHSRRSKGTRSKASVILSTPFVTHARRQCSGQCLHRLDT